MSFLKDVLTRFRFKTEDGKLKATTAATKAAEKRMYLATRQANAFQAKLAGVGSAVTALGGLLLARFGVQSLITDFADGADQAAKMSQAMGISVETYQRLSHAAGLSGTSIENLQASMANLGKRARDANAGSKKTAEAFKELGVATKNADGTLRSQDDILMDVADRFKAMPDGATKTALAMELMGKTGAKMIPLLNAGSEGIQAMGDEAAALGIVMDREALAEAEAFNDELLRMKAVVTGLRNKIALALLPTITKLSKRFIAWFKVGDRSTKTLEILKKAAKVAGVALAGLAAKKLINGFVTVGQSIMGMVKAVRTLGTAALTAQAKMAAIVVGIGLLILGVEDLIGFTQGKDSLFGRMLDTAGIDPEPIKDTLIEVGKSFKVLGKKLKASATKIRDALGFVDWESFGKGAIEAFADTVVFVAISVGAIVDSLMWLGEFLGETAAKIYLFYSDLGENLGALWHVMVVAWKNLWLEAELDAAAAWESIVETLEATWSGIVGAVAAVGDGIVAVWDAIWGAIADGATWLRDGIEAVFSGIGDFFVGIFDAALLGFLTVLEGAINGVADLLDMLPDFVIDELPSEIASFISHGVDLTSDFEGSSSSSSSSSPPTSGAFAPREERESISANVVAEVDAFLQDGGGRTVEFGGGRESDFSPLQFGGPIYEPKTTTHQNTFTVTATVPVEGSVDMSAPEFVEQIRTGAEKVFADAIEAVFDDTAEVF